MARGLAVERRWRNSAADRVEADLAELWREAGRRTPVSRALMANLVVLSTHDPGEPVDLAAPPDAETVEAVSARHPSRVIRIHHESQTSGNARPIAVAVGVVTSGPPHARYGVEHIAIRSACAAESLASMTRALTIGDVPTSLWWTSDLPGHAALTPLALESRQVLYDSRRWKDVPGAVRVLAPMLRDEFTPDLADVNWRRLGPVRHAMLHAVEGHEMPGRPPSLAIRHRPGEAALAWLLAGWWTSRLPGEATIAQAEMADAMAVDVVLEQIRFRIRLTVNAAIVEETVGLSPFALGAPAEGEADAVAAELQSLTHDACLYDALSALAHRFRAA